MPYLTQDEIDSGILDKFKQYDPEEVKKQHELAWNNSPGYQDLFEGKEQYEPGKVDSPSGVVPDRGFVGDVASNLARGAGDLTRMGGYALKTIDPDGGIDILEKAGQKMIDVTDYAEKNLGIMKQDQSEAAGEGLLSRGWKGGVRSSVPSIAPVLAGGSAGSVFGPVGALVGAGIGTLGLFGFGVYGEKRQEYIDQGIEKPEAEKAAFKQALIEGGIETAGSLIGLKIFGVDKFITQPLKQSLKELIETPLSTWGKKLATDTFLNEIPTEMLQEALGSQVETGLGLQDEGAWREAMVEAIVPAMVMSLGFGLGSQGLTMVNKRNLKNQINNLDDPKARLKAVEAIEKGILAHEKKGDDTGISNNAEAWSAMAMDRIEEGKPIELNTDFVTYATNGEDVLSAMRGKVGEGMSLEYRDKLTKRINNLSLFRSLTPRQKELREQYLIELANVDKEIASQQQNKTKITDTAQQSQQNIIGPESDQFEQFQEGFRDQKIGEFEQNLKQAQDDIAEYPDRPPIQPDIESLRKEWEDRKVQAEANAPATSRRQLIADESNTFDDFLYNIQSDTFENNLRSAQADIQQQPQQAPIQPDVEALRREYENKQAPVETESKLSRPQGMLYSQQQQPVVGPMPDSRQQEAKPELEPTTGMGLKDKGQQSFVDQRIQKLGSIDAVDKAYGRDDNVSQYARAKAREVFGQDVLVETVKPVEETMVNNTPNASEPSAPMGVTPPTIKETLSVAPGQSVTWKDKKGKVISGKVVKKQSKAGSAWQVIKPDGKKTFVHEKYLRPVDAAANNPQVQDQGEVYVSGSDQVGRGSQSQKNEPQSGLQPTGEPQTLAKDDIPSNTLEKAQKEAKREDSTRLVYQHPNHKHWIVSSRGPGETYPGKIYSVMPNGSVDIWRDGIEKSLEPEQEAETTEKQPWKMNLLEYGKSRLPASQAEQITDSKHVKSFSAQHRNEVKTAIDRGERVPKSVLEDHPDLARQYDDQVAKWEMIKSTGMDWVRYVPVEKSSDNDTTAIHESSQPVQTVTNHVAPKPDSNLKTIDELSDRIESIDRQISKLENIDNQSDFDEKNAKIEKLNARKDSLLGKRSSLLSGKKQDNTIEKFESDLSRKGTGSIQSGSGRIDYSIQAKDDGNGFYFQYVEDGARYTKGGAGPNRWSQQEAIDRAVADAKGRAGDPGGTGKEGHKPATLKDVTESKFQVGDTVQFKKASRSHSVENEHVIDDILSNGKIVLAGNNNLPYRHEFHRDDFKKIKPSNSEKKEDRADYGAKNKVFTAEAADRARELLRKKLSGNQLNSGIDPEVLLAGIQLGGYHIEAGARTFSAYSKAMIQDVGDSVKPYLRSFYEGVRHFPGFDSSGMTESNVLDNETDAIENEVTPTSTPEPTATIEEVNDDRSQEDEERPGIQNLDQEDGETVPGGRDGVLAGNVEHETTEYDNVLGISSPEDVRGPEKPGSVEGDGIRPGMQDDGAVGRTEGIRDEQFGREAASGTGLDDNEPGGVGRTGGTGIPGEPDRVLENYHIEDPEALIGGTPKVRFKKNQKAIEVFNEVSNEGRRPTAEERDAMAAYIGWGSFGQELFQGTFENPTYKDGWAKEGEWLRSHLGKSAWESAQASIINAHYTDPPTVSAIWDIVKQLGFNGGRVLEPSMGIGNFLGLMPKGLKSNSDLTGIELDETTAGMAKMLYPEANIQQMGYQDSKTADGFYDIVLGNWPFAAQGPADRRYNKYHLTLHDYFFIKALDQVRAGGLVVGITASGTMDKVGKMARLQIGKRADLVAAFRMPTGAFQKYAGTNVVADVIILQKRAEGATANHDAAWLENTVLGKAADGKEIKVNEYWIHKPENVLGNMTIGHGTTQGREGMIVERQQGYEDVLSSLTDRLPKNIITKRGQIDHVNYITNNTTERQNSVTIKDNGLYIVRGERLARLNDELKYSVKDEKETEAREAELKSLVRIRDRYGKLLDAERNGEKTAENHRAILNQLYKAFVKKYGNLNGSFALKHFARAEDPMAPAMAALEKNTGTKENPVYEPAKIFTASTQRQKAEIKNPSISDAFVMTRNEVARVVDIESIAEKAGTTPEAVKAELIKKDAIFETPAGTFEVKDIYLSGNVREKLREAKAAKEDGLDMDRNIKALEAVIPDDIPYFNIEATMGAAWIPAETYKQFITDTANLPDANGIHITPSNNGWIVKFDDAGMIDGRQEVKTIWSTPGASFTKILRSAFTGQTITIKTKDEDGNEYVDKEMSTAANEKVGALREALKDWIWKDVDRRVALEQHYNETMNAWATPAYDGSFLSFDGMMLQKGESEFNLRRHQVNAIWRGVANGRGLYAHEVGTGKTFTMGGIAVESRRYGLAKKPLILAHNANSASVADDIQNMYPGAKVLYIDNLTPKTIDQKLYQIANDEWDAVVLPHSLLDRLTLSRETLDRLAQDEIMSLEEEAIASAADEGFDIEKILDDEEALRKIRGATTAKEMVKQRNRIIQNIEKQAQAASREGAIPFESLGLDMLIVDEVHEFKKPPLSTKMKVKGLNTTASGRSIGLNFLASYIKEQNNGKGVHIFTGTPITNTLNEIYNHMRYVMSSEMEKADVLSWDSWFNTFASVESDIERTSSGEYEMVSRLSGFHNVSELRKFAGQYMDIVFAEDMPEFVPRKTQSGKDLHSNDLTDAERDELVNGRVDEGSPSGRPYKKLVNEVADMSEEQRGILQTLVARAKSFKDASGKERREIMLSGDPRNPVVIETDAAKAGFDPRLYDKELSDHPRNKINRCVNNVLKHYHEHEKACQVIFMEKGYNDQATRSKRDGAGEKATFKVDTFNASKDLKNKLIEGGIPAEQIAIVNGSVAKKKRLEISNKVNSGEVRVVIGLTSTLGTGTNMQENLRAMHHLDAPWMPGELEQRNGRGHRQGNRWNTVLEYRYITESIDARRWQVLAKKQKMITDFLKAKEGVRSIEGDAVDLGSSDLDEINSSFSEAAGDARILIREKLKKDIEKLERKERTHSQGIVDAKNKIKGIEGRSLPNLKDKVKGMKSDIEHYQSASKEPWAITIDGKKYTKRQEANVALEKLSLKLSTRDMRLSEKKKIGSYRGFDIMVSGSVGHGNTYSMKRDLSYPIKPSTGSIDFLTRSFSSMLDDARKQVAEETNAMDKFKQVAKEPFAQEKALQSKKESLVQLERDLESNPDAPPSWLAQGAPVGTDVYYKGEPWEVDGHRKGEHGHYVIIKQGENQEVVDYLEVMDENNLPVYATLDDDSGAKYSTSTDAKYKTSQQIDKAPGQGLSIQDIQSHFPGQSVSISTDNSISIRFTNGKGCRIKSVDNIGGDDIRYAMETGRMSEGGVILGKYQDQTITLNKNLANAETLTHETLHLLKDMGVLTPADLMSLDAHREKLARDGKYRYEVLNNKEENHANTLAQLISDREAYRNKSALNRIIQKIMDFWDGLIYIGRQSAIKLAREYESGKIYSRDTNDKAESTPRFQTAGNTNSDAFKKWFGKSVGKTKDGKPVVFYHGTPNQFTVFEDRSGQSTTHTASGLGHFFTMDNAYANAYSKETGNVMQVYLKMEKPYRMSLDEAQSFNTITDAVVKKRRLKLKGYDSVIITVPGAMPMIVVFNPNQIKSVSNYGAWSPDNPDIRYSTFADAVSIKENESAYKQIASGLKNVLSNHKNKGKGYKPDIGVIENTLGLMSHYSEKIPAMKRTFDELMKRPEWKFEKENELSKNGEESMIGTLDDLKKHNKGSYDILKDYLIYNDINQIGAVIFQAEDGTWTILSEKDKKTGKRTVLEEGIATKQEARALVIEYEVDAYPDPSGSDALRAFRTMTSNLHDFYAESWEAIIKDYEDRGLTLPQVVTKTKSGDVRIDLKVALAQMGDRSSYYFPRQRSNGDWQVYGKKQGRNDFVDYRDNKVTADYLAGKMKAQGYDVEVKKIGSMSEDVYQSVKNILATQAMVNQALNETKLDAKQRTLEDIGLSGEWRGQDYFIPNGGVYEWSSSVLKDLGGMEYSDRGKDGRSWSPGYWFEKAPKDIEELVTNALYISRGQETDISFEISQSLANQLSDTLRARGSRARMIARSDAVGKDVPIGYETDPVSAIAQAVNAAAGGYAKQQVAMNTSKAITGQHYTWEEWQKQHQDYDALVNAEDELSALTKNSETEEERIADIDREIKDLHREGAGVATESEKARQDRLLRIGKLFREKEKIRKWEDDKQAAKLHQDIARLRSNIHKEYRAYIQDNMLDSKKQKRAYDDAVNAVENVLKNDEAGDRVINTLKGLTSVWFLGGRLSSAAINLTSMGTTVPAAMDAYGGIPLQKTMKHIVKAGKAYASFVTGKGNVSQADRLILEEIFSRGWIAAQLNMETVNALKSGPAKKYGRAVELLMIPFKLTEEFNRGTTILAAYKGIMAENPGMIREDALLKAKKVSDRAHGIYGVENQPALLRKGRGLRAASAMYIFQTYMHNYLTTLAYMIGRKQAKAATYMILSPMVFGGAASSLLMPAIKMIFKAIGEDDPEEKIYQIAEELFGETGGDIARYGLPGLAGVNFKGSLAPNMPDFQEPLDALGPIGGMMRNIYDGAVNITHGDYLKGVEKISPLAIGNVAKAYRESTQGVTTRAGDPVFFGNKQIKGDFGTGLMRAAGMNPTKISKPREIQWHETELKQQYAERKRNIYSRIIRYHAQPGSEKNPDEWKEIIMEIKEFNARVKSNGFNDVMPLITHKTIKARVKRAFRPNKRERLRDDM